NIKDFEEDFRKYIGIPLRIAGAEERANIEENTRREEEEDIDLEDEPIENADKVQTPTYLEDSMRSTTESQSNDDPTTGGDCLRLREDWTKVLRRRPQNNDKLKSLQGLESKPSSKRTFTSPDHLDTKRNRELNKEELRNGNISQVPSQGQLTTPESNLGMDVGPK
ncbi:Hypothetical protein FKW44_010404, partial [Caligus rogercresseyi]